MAKQIVWTPQAKIDRFEILEFYYRQGISKSTLSNIDFQIRDIIRLLRKFNNLGKEFGKHSERILYKGHFSIIYKVGNNQIEVLQIWDNRRDPTEFTR